MRAICLKGYETFKALSREEKEPFYELVKEKRLSENGGRYEKAGEVFGELAIVGKEGRLLTGQNPTSAGALGEAVVKALGV